MAGVGNEEEERKEEADQKEEEPLLKTQNRCAPRMSGVSLLHRCFMSYRLFRKVIYYIINNKMERKRSNIQKLHKILRCTFSRPSPSFSRL